MTSDDLARVLESLIDAAFPGLADARRSALRDEKVRALARRGKRYDTARVGGAVGLVAEGSYPGRGWILGLDRRTATVRDARDVLARLDDATRAFGREPKIRVGGPPGNYLVSGIDARDTSTLDFYLTAGFTEERRHIDVHATLADPAPLDPRIRRARADERDAILAWIGAHFAPAWAIEAALALDAHDALFVSVGDGGYQGFGAHSGNNAALGTFGPIGVLESARRGGLGAALARAALDDLYARGFRDATIPWVDPALRTFYERIVRSCTVVDRIVLARSL